MDAMEWVFEKIISKYNYWISVILMLIGFYAIIAKENLMKKIIGLNIFQTAIFLFFISLGAVRGGTAPIVARR
jgi:multicomponent Na+:H+ antiporter subunit C